MSENKDPFSFFIDIADFIDIAEKLAQLAQNAEDKLKSGEEVDGVKLLDEATEIMQNPAEREDWPEIIK